MRDTRGRFQSGNTYAGDYARQDRAHYLFTDCGLSHADIAAEMGEDDVSVVKDLLYRYRVRTDTIAPTRHRPRFSQLSACGSNAA